MPGASKVSVARCAKVVTSKIQPSFSPGTFLDGQLGGAAKTDKYDVIDVLFTGQN